MAKRDSVRVGSSQPRDPTLQRRHIYIEADWRARSNQRRVVSRAHRSTRLVVEQRDAPAGRAANGSDERSTHGRGGRAACYSAGAVVTGRRWGVRFGRRTTRVADTVGARQGCDDGRTGARRVSRVTHDPTKCDGPSSAFYVKTGPRPV